MNKKRLIYVILGVIAAILAMVILLSLSLSDKNINGITGVLGAARLVFNDENGVKLTNEPLQYMIKGGNEDENANLEALLDSITESYNMRSFFAGRVEINGLTYTYSCRSFTNMFWIVTFTLE